ncbi:uncharacterized protein LOC115883538 [Sitophilus oryzae]|uniref:Uncharacterized protein LOC115883538 n=1 Tax=Sitophilus oryzae TaxID=7048 RepID=A0A6J2Y446_SITOR|nr:uncharacterized protein LOC115883538 [Sitophilus oryzae]
MGQEKQKYLIRLLKKKSQEQQHLYCLIKVLHLKNLDEVTTIEEITAAICSALSIEKCEVDVRGLRPAYGGKQNATVIIAKDEANKLLQLGQIPIGWMNCKMAERQREIKCYRCWQYGHIKSQCEGPDRSSQCVKCSETAHKAVDCKNEPHCISCNQGGHQTGSNKCPKIRQLRMTKLRSNISNQD